MFDKCGKKMIDEEWGIVRVHCLFFAPLLCFHVGACAMMMKPQEQGREDLEEEYGSSYDEKMMKKRERERKHLGDRKSRC